MSADPVSYNQTFDDWGRWSVRWDEQNGDSPIRLTIHGYDDRGQKYATIITLNHRRAYMLMAACREAAQQIDSPGGSVEL